MIRQTTTRTDYKFSFLMIMFILAVSAVSYTFIMQYDIEKEEKIGASINISGKQRMLSQRILAYFSKTS